MLAVRVLGTRFHDENPRMSSTYVRERERGNEEEKRGKKEREVEAKREIPASVFLRYLTLLRFYGMHGMVQPARFTNSLSRFMLRERLVREILLKDRLLNAIARLAFALLENIEDEKSINRFIAMSLGHVCVSKRFSRCISICGR